MGSCAKEVEIFLKQPQSEPQCTKAMILPNPVVAHSFAVTLAELITLTILLPEY